MHRAVQIGIGDGSGEIRQRNQGDEPEIVVRAHLLGLGQHRAIGGRVALLAVDGGLYGRNVAGQGRGGIEKCERGGCLRTGWRGMRHQIHALIDAGNAAVGSGCGGDLGDVERAVRQHQPVVGGTILLAIRGNHNFADVVGADRTRFAR